MGDKNVRVYFVNYWEAFQKKRGILSNLNVFPERIKKDGLHTSNI